MKIAVCIPTYNRADIISDAIDSLIHQKKADFDIHVFDNFSTDNTEDLIRNKYKEEVIYHKNSKNVGFVGNMNYCLQLESKYDWIGILHSDDLHVNESVFDVGKYLEKYPDAGLVFSEYNIIDENKKIVTAGNSFEKRFKAGLDAINMSQKAIPCSATFYNAKAIKKVGFYDHNFPYSADEEYNNRIACLFDIVRIGKVIANHRMHSDNLRIETWLEPDFVTNYEVMRRKMLEKSILSKGTFEKWINRHMAIICLQISNALLKSRHYKFAKKYNNLAWRYYPSILLNPKLFLKSSYIFFFSLANSNNQK